MASSLRLIAITALAPALWGGTYVLFTEALPTTHPLWVGALRTLLAGLLLMLGVGAPPRRLWAPLAILGTANVGLFSALLFVSASRLPGGTAATLASTQPLIAALVAWPLFGRPPAATVAAALVGIGGIGLVVLDPSTRLDPIGLAAALGAAASMATGTVLVRRWRGIAEPLPLAAWQLTFGGLFLSPAAVLLEGAPPVATPTHVAALVLLVTVGTAFAFWIWIRGVAVLGPDAAFLGLLSPVVAASLGAALLGEWFSAQQLVGVGLVLGATAAGMAASPRHSFASASRGGPTHLEGV
ncbi:MAG: EamA family transporter [Sandaracinus sp.]|nr:EamA family transporter [Sandaracinus sp.]MCB9613188.1 EamA family transporter [Sandaracinus sp.]